MKKRAFLLIIFVFAAAFWGNLFFCNNNVKVCVLQISNLQQYNEVSTDDVFDTIILKKNLTQNELINAIKRKSRTQAQSAEVSVSSDLGGDLSEQEIIDFCEENDFFVITTDYGYEIYYKFQLKTLVVDCDVRTYFGAIEVEVCGDVKILKYATEEDTKLAYENLKDMSKNVVADRIVTIAAIDNFSTGNFNSWGADAMDLDVYKNYYKSSGSSKETVVAVLDTGINTSHELFANRLLTSGGKIVGYCDEDITTKYTYSSYAFEDDNTHSTNSSGSLVAVYNGHGSHVSGTICDLTPTNVKILPMKIFNYKGSGAFSSVLDALNQLVTTYKSYNVVAANLSLGGLFDTTSDATYWNNKFTTTFNTLRQNNILPVVAAGNNSKDTSYTSPGGCGDSAIVVSALKQNLTSVVFDSSYSNFGSSVDISAPGTGIYSASIGTSASSSSTKSYKTLQGTSMATPHVTAAVALLCLDGKYHVGTTSTYTASEIENRLFSCAVDLGSTGKDTLYGYGMVNFTYFNGNITYSVTNKTTTYNGNYHNISVSVSGVSDYSICYGFTASSCNITDITTSAKFKNFTNGPMNVYFKITSNTFIDTIGVGQLTINQAPISLTTQNQTSVYGNAVTLDQTKYTKTAGTICSGDSLGVTLSTSATSTSSVGEYDISATISNSNYKATVTKGKYVITQRPISITLKKQTFTYGDAINLSSSAYEITSTNKVVNGDNLNLKISTTATAGSGVNKYQITFVSANSNYLVSATNGELEITPRVITIYSQQAGFYGDEIKLEQTYSIVDGSVISGDLLNITLSTTATNKSNVGTYDITASSTNANYEIKNDDSTYTIYRRLATVRPSAQTSTYGNKVVLLPQAYVVENLVNGDTVEIVLSTQANETSVVADYQITASVVKTNVTENYTFSIKSGTLSVVARPITISAKNQTSVYGENVQIDTSLWELTSGNIVNDDQISVNITTSANSTSSVGDYDLVVYASGDDVKNYSITTKNGTFSITKRSITIKVLNQETVYGREISLKTLYEVTSDLKIVNNDNLNIVLNTTATSSSPAGDYPITLTYLNDNYNVTSVNGVLSIKGKEVKIKILPQTSIYGDPVSLDQTKYTIEENVENLNISLKTSANHLSDVGEYSITATSGNINVFLNYEYGVLTIAPRSLNITIKNQTCTYGDVNISQNQFTLGETVNGDNVQITLTTNATNSSSVGKYEIDASTSNTNYSLVKTKGILNIEPKSISITLNAQENVYGSINITQTAYFLNPTPINNDELNINLTTNATNSSSIGDYDISFSYNNNNYNLTGSKGTLKVTARPITIRVNQSSAYGENVSLNPYQYEVITENGIVNSDDLQLQMTTDANNKSKIGTYDVCVNSSNDNYIVAIEKASVQITKRQITVTVQNQVSEYGDIVTLDQSKFVVNGVVNNDDLGVVLTTNATSLSPVNKYMILASYNGEDVDNYSITTQTGELEITKRNLTLKIEDQQSMYGAQIQLQVLYSIVSQNQVVNNDDLNIRLTTTATINSPVGTYPISLTYSNNNYELTYIEGTLSIVEGDMIITILPQTFVYGDEIVLNQLAFEANVDIDKSELGVTLSTNATQYSPVGDAYEIDLTYTNTNYAIVVQKGKLTITPYEISITLQNQECIYGDVWLDQSKFKLDKNLLNSDDLGLRLTTEATNLSEANNEYSIGYEWANKNYNVKKANSATLKVLPREVKIKTTQSSIYGNNIEIDNSKYSIEEGIIVNNDSLGITFSTKANKGSPIGDYSTTVSYTNKNYSVSLSNDSIYKVLPREIILSIEQSKYYGDKIDLDILNYVIISGNVVSGDDLSLELSTAATKESKVGEYPINLDGFNSNYDITLKKGVLNVVKRVVFIEAIKTGEYGSYFALNNDYNVVEGSIAFNTDELDVRFSTNATNISKVGNYNLEMRYDNENYDVELKSTSYFQVLPRKLKIKIGNQSSEYGNDVVVDQNNYQITSGSVVNQDVVNIALSTDANKYSNAGNYEIKGTLQNENYYLIYNEGIYTVAKRKVAIKLNNQKTARGLTFEIDQNAYEIVEGNIIEGDDLNLEIYSNAKKLSMMGNYHLMAKNNNENYEVTIIQGNLFLNISVLDIALAVVFIGISILVTIKVVKHKRAKRDNQKLFDKWIKW